VKTDSEKAAKAKRKRWKPHYGLAYDLSTKRGHLVPLLRKLDSLGKLGKVIVDVGSGSTMVSDGAGRKIPAIYTPRGKKLIRVDLATPHESRRVGDVLELQADIEHTTVDSTKQRKKLVGLARFLGLDPRSKAEVVDSIVMSDILNYVDFRRTIQGLSKYLKNNGRIVILNKPERGHKKSFSEHGVKRNGELTNFLRRNGFEIEHLIDINRDVGVYPVIQKRVGKGSFILLVAKKK